MAKLNLGSMFSVAGGRDAVSGESYHYMRSRHSGGGNKKFRQCVAEKMRGASGDARTIRERLSSAAKGCRGTR